MHNVHQFHFYKYTGDFLKFVNITDDVMLSSAYFYIHYCKEYVVSRGRGDCRKTHLSHSLQG